MGDIADWMLGSCDPFEDEQSLDEDEEDEPRGWSCKYCGMADLQWRMDAQGKKRLYPIAGFNASEPHSCKEYFELRNQV